jgi:hypothetical protein
MRASQCANVVWSDLVKSHARRIPIPFIEKDFDLKDATPLELELGKGTGIKLTCYCANGMLANGTDVLGSQKSAKKKDISPNDVSLAMLLEWGEFRYLTAGDMSGDESLRAYYNIETALVEYLTNGPLKGGKKITVFKASHHGSEHSNQQDLLTKLSPETIVISSHLKKSVPSPVFLERLSGYFKGKVGAQVVITNTMRVVKNDDRYTSLEAIKSAIADGNVELIEVDGEHTASNLGIKYAIIRRRMRDNRYVDYSGTYLPAEFSKSFDATEITTPKIIKKEYVRSQGLCRIGHKPISRT